MSPHYIEPYRNSKRVGEVAYKLELPPNLSRVHSVFHFSMLRKCFANVYQVIPVQPEVLQEDLSVMEDAIQILDRKERVLRNKVVPLVLVQWRHHGSEEATREQEMDIRSQYPYLFA